MNKTLSIGLAGFSFVIEEHAYIKLSEYLAALRNSLDTSEAEEVMHDIEIRMVEIFKDSLGKREVINNEDVEKVIAQIGKPEQIEEQEEAYFSENTKNRKNNGAFSEKRQLFRDPSRAKIAGVLSGLSYYLGIDVTLLRLIPVGIILLDIFTTWGISSFFIFLLYIVLWIVLPKAETASDFLKMKGKPVNFDTLKEESNKIVQFANDSTQKVGEIYNENKPYINKAGSGLWNAIRFILGIIFAMMGVTLLIGSFAMFGIYDGSNVNFFENVGFYLQENNLGALLIGLAFLTIFIPALIFIFIAIKLFSPNTKLNNAGYVFGALVLLWIGLGAFAGFSAIKYKNQYSGNNEETENIAINTTSDTIMVDMKKVAIPQNFKSYWDDVYSDGKTIYKEDWISLQVKKEEVKAPYLIIKKRADGYNQPLNMKIPLEIVGNKVLLPNYFTYDYKNRFRDYHLDYELIVPKKMTVINMNNNEVNIENDEENNTGTNSNSSVSSSTSGNSISISSDDKDSVIINGKKYPQKFAEKILDSMKVDIDNLKDVNISLKDGKSEISIKTK